MSTPPIPDDVPIGLEDFRRSPWREVLKTQDEEQYTIAYNLFHKASQQAAGEGRQADAKIFKLLSNATSMMLAPQSLQQPFKPILVMDNRRSTVPEDFTPEDLQFFTEIIDEVDIPRLKARLADLLWLVGKPRNHKFALLAIDNYLSIPLNADTWVRDGRESWKRAISLTLMLGTGAGDRLETIEREILARFKTTAGDDSYLALWLSDLLFDNEMARSESLPIAKHLEAIAVGISATGAQRKVGPYFECAEKWYRVAGVEEKAAAMIAGNAESWVNAAIARQGGQNQSQMVASNFFDNAIQAYRRIPTQFRKALRVDERLSELKGLMTDARGRSVGELRPIETPGIDISNIVYQAEEAIRGKTLIDALGGFAGISQGIDPSKLRQSAIEALRDSPLQALFSTDFLSREGRVVARREGITPLSSASENEDAIRVEMLRHYQIELGLIVQGILLPAFRILTLEHRITFPAVLELIGRSPIIPPGRHIFFAKAIYAGFDHDVATAIYLLAPQIEHLVRWQFRLRSVPTTTLDANGIETEIGLTALMARPEIASIFDGDLAFELRALFTEATGPNFRNEVAHGLLGFDAASSAPAIYAWWWCYRLLFMTAAQTDPPTPS